MKALLALALCTASVALAQAPAAKSESAQALDLAGRLGRERSVEGLETILRSGNPDLLRAYRDGSGQVGSALMPPEIEAIILRNYDDPVVGPRLATLCSQNGARCSSPALFERMLAEMRSGKIRPVLAHDLRYGVSRFEGRDVDATLLAWLRAPDAPSGPDLEAILQGLASRKYEPAVPMIAAQLAKAPPGQPGIGVYALGNIGTPAAIDGLLARLAVLKRAPPTPEVRKEILDIGGRMAALPEPLAPSYERLRAVLPEDVRDYAITWLRRKDFKAVPDALVLLGDKVQVSNALNALLATDSPEIWKQARAEVERLSQEGRINANDYTSAKYHLDPRLADPAKYFAQKQAGQEDQAILARHQALEQKKSEALKLVTTNPEASVAGLREHVAAVEKLLAENRDSRMTHFIEGRLAMSHLEAGHVVRFRLKQPQEALLHYAAAQQRGSVLGGFAIADTWQFDLRDAKRALAEYRKLLPASEAWPRRWLAAQIAFLETGKTFSGALGEQDLGFDGLLRYYDGSSDLFGLAPWQKKVFQGDPRTVKIDRKEVDRILRALPPSGLVLLQSMWMMSLLPDAPAVLAHLKRHDPAGYASACYFALVELMGRAGGEMGMMIIAPGMLIDPAADPLREAGVRFLREHRIDTKALAAAAEKRRQR